MNKYIKPTISLVASGTTTASASSCSTSTSDAKQIKDILISMGYDINQAFGFMEPCEQQVAFEDYCKFTSSIQIFFS
ncbi:MAG: hypothetical protein IJO36_09080 [Clostridia bacterium]|nr:hypothetical protein [Clostridia bacterium]